MKRDKLRIGVITAALAMMIAGGVLTWQQDARNGKADQAKQGETAQLTEDESTGTTEQQTEETAGDADGTRAVQDHEFPTENADTDTAYPHFSILFIFTRSCLPNQ